MVLAFVIYFAKHGFDVCKCYLCCKCCQLRCCEVKCSQIQAMFVIYAFNYCHFFMQMPAEMMSNEMHCTQISSKCLLYMHCICTLVLNIKYCHFLYANA